MTIDETETASTEASHGRSLLGPGLALGQVDRFELRGLLGIGGMGTVYEAWDEKLQRRIALKFLRGPQGSERGERRFFREAQGLARISHPNVVAVYDIGRFDGVVWIAMEFVLGQTLGSWVSTSPRTQTEVLAKWIEAGRGLAAIHDAGLIHRDIKPNNVLLGDDGRVRVIDLGLVKAVDTLDGTAQSDGEVSPPLATSGSGSGELERSLTEVEQFVGTPAYAAPEHWDRRWVDTRSDQYSYCVALWECLCKQRPSRTERKSGALVPLPAGVRMPRRLHLVLSRGLSLEPGDRFPDMHALVAALAPLQRRWVAPMSAALGTALVVGGIASMMIDPPIVHEDPCANADAPVAPIWTENRRQQLGPWARERVDEWVGTWSSAAKTSCEDVHVRRLYSQDVLDRRASCLDRQLDGLEVVMRAFEQDSAPTSANLIEWLGVLEHPDACLGDAALRLDQAPPAPEYADEIRDLHRRLLVLGIGSRDYRDRIGSVEQLRTRAEQLGDRRLIGEAALTLGVLFTKTHDIERARVELGRALDIGLAIRDLELAAAAWSNLFKSALNNFDREQASWLLERHAALLEGSEPGPRQRARLLVDRATHLTFDSRFDEAELALREALPLYEAEGISGSWEQGAAERTLGWILVGQGRHEEALAAYARARELELGEVGQTPGGASTAKRVLDESIAQIGNGEFATARAGATEGLRHAASEQGARSEMVVRFHIVMAAACNGLGDLDCTRTHSGLADELSLVAVGPTNPLRIDVLSTVGVVAYADERPEAAVAAFNQALAIARREFESDSTVVASAESNLASALRNAGQLERAAELSRHALESLERRLPAEHPSIIRESISLAEIELDRKDPVKARALLERALDQVAESDAATRTNIEELLIRARE